MQLLIAEYQGIRNEILESFKLTQAIIQWSLAIYGVGFGAGLVAANEATKPQADPFLQWMVFGVFAVLLPGLMSAASFHWLGEITRMERAGSYVRGLEYELKDAAFAVGSERFLRPLNWERHLQQNQSKRWLPYVAVAALFGGTFAVSLGAAAFWMMHKWGWDYRAVVGGIFILLVYAGVACWIGLDVRRLGKLRYNFKNGSLVEWDSSSPRLLTVEQVAEELLVGLPTIRRLLRTGELRGIQVGGRGKWRIARTDLENYIEQADAITAKRIAAGEVPDEKD